MLYILILLVLVSPSEISEVLRNLHINYFTPHLCVVIFSHPNSIKKFLHYFRQWSFVLLFDFLNWQLPFMILRNRFIEVCKPRFLLSCLYISWIHFFSSNPLAKITILEMIFKFFTLFIKVILWIISLKMYNQGCILSENRICTDRVSSLCYYILTVLSKLDSGWAVFKFIKYVSYFLLLRLFLSLNTRIFKL